MQRRAPLTALLAGALVACGGSQEKVSVETRDAPAPDVAANVKTAPAPTETPQVAPEGAPRGFEFNRDGAAARYAVPAANQATLNHIQGFDYAVVIARPEPTSTEGLQLKIGGVDLEHARFPLAVHEQVGSGPGSAQLVLYAGAGETYAGSIASARGRLEVVLEGWDPQRKRLWGTFAGPLFKKGGDAKIELEGGRFDVLLSNPFGGGAP